MRLADGTILMHGPVPYDPVKAHEYYIRTRKLKGSKPRLSVVSKPVTRRSPTYSVRLSSGTTVKLSQNQLKEQQAYAAKRVGDIKKRLGELGTKLRQLRANAKRKKSPTAADKSKAARESRQYRQKHRQELATKAKTARAQKSSTRKTSKDPVAELEHKINQVKGRLQAAVETQRALITATRIG